MFSSKIMLGLRETTLYYGAQQNCAHNLCILHKFVKLIRPRQLVNNAQNAYYIFTNCIYVSCPCKEMKYNHRKKLGFPNCNNIFKICKCNWYTEFFARLYLNVKHTQQLLEGGEQKSLGACFLNGFPLIWSIIFHLRQGKEFSYCRKPCRILLATGICTVVEREI